MECQLDVRTADMPAGYSRRTGLEYSEHYGRYLWRPKVGDLIYAYEIGKVYEYLKWSSMLKGSFYAMDGYARVKDIETGEEYWTPNIEVRKCVPIERKRS